MFEGFNQPIDSSTRFCAVFGHPISHSASPAMHNAALAALGFNWRYAAFDVRPQELQEAIRGAAGMRMAGLNLTVPHKLPAVTMMDVLDESARAWGGVNTVRFECLNREGAWAPVGCFGEETAEQVRTCGFNTDAEALTRSLAEDLGWTAKGARLLVLGAGGAGRMAALKLASEGVAALHLVNRTTSKAEKLAAEVQVRFPGVRVTVGVPGGAVDLVLNATSQGLREGEALPLLLGDFSLGRAKAVYDLVYRPPETPLLKQAREAGCRVANGLGMLLYQGAKALELWTGRAAPLEVMREALRRNVYG